MSNLSRELQEKYEAVIGLEVHAQLLTRSKMFCSCQNLYGMEPNSQVCPVCTGQPGSLPVLNQGAIELGVRAALAVGGTVHQESIFARKNYFYPDLPKGYQISQYERPFCTGGSLTIQLKDGSEKKIGLTRIHFEEDAGKSVHDFAGTRVNLNRAGVPLCEIVSEPDMRTAEEAGQYLRKLRSILRYADVCDGNMDEGSFRCDANISVRRRGATKFGTRTELKNINSFRYVEKAIEYEIDRQIQAVEAGEKIRQQTRSFDPAKGITEVMRDKEEANDYRYFPEPDLPPLLITNDWMESIRKSLPELPDAKKARFTEQHGLSGYDAAVLTSSRELSRFFEEVVAVCKQPKIAANWVMNELLGRLHAVGKEIEATPVTSANLGTLIQLIESGEISGKIAKTVFDDMFTAGKAPRDVIKEKGLTQISDTGALEAAIRKTMEANPTQLTDYKAGKVKLLGFFVGQVMKETQGQANPKVLNELVKKLLDG